MGSKLSVLQTARGAEPAPPQVCAEKTQESKCTGRNGSLTTELRAMPRACGAARTRAGVRRQTRCGCGARPPMHPPPRARRPACPKSLCARARARACVLHTPPCTRRPRAHRDDTREATCSLGRRPPVLRGGADAAAAAAGCCPRHAPPPLARRRADARAPVHAARARAVRRAHCLRHAPHTLTRVRAHTHAHTRAHRARSCDRVRHHRRRRACRDRARARAGAERRRGGQTGVRVRCAPPLHTLAPGAQAACRSCALPRAHAAATQHGGAA
jgi:hypothetical protein